MSDEQTVKEPTAKVDEQPKDDPVKEMEIKNWIDYFRPHNVSVIMGKKYGAWTALVMLYYVLQFVMCVSACNFYSDVTRKSSCSLANDVDITGDKASAVFDTAIKLGGVFHIIEWVRSTILLTVILIGAPLMIVWYATAVSAIYGIAAFIYIHVTYFGTDGQACLSAQETRGQWLMFEIIYFWTLFFFF